MNDRRVVRRTLVALTMVLVPAIAAEGVERSGSFLAALESIRRDELQGHVDFLASDSLEGREAGTREGRRAGDYVACCLANAGLRGAGEDGGFFQPFPSNYRNVLAVLEGGDPLRRTEYVLVGAHYDHVGYGTVRNSRGPVGQIHNGADDNASGVAGLLEVAEALPLLAPPPRRSILLVGWDAEEKGLLGSRYWRDRPTVPLDRVTCVVTMDMIGRLRNDRLTVYGSRTGYGSRRLVSLSNQIEGLRLLFDWRLKANSDHHTFLQREVPILLFHTGLHEAYHSPRDDPERINAAGIERVGRLILAVVCDLANAHAPLRFRSAAWHEAGGLRGEGSRARPKPPPRLGVSWDPEAPEGRGVEIVRVFKKSAAEEARLQPGDRILEIDGQRIRSPDDLRAAVALAGPEAVLVLQPGDGREPVTRTVRLPGRPLRLGIRWRTDEAEPQAVILTAVVPGTPAATAGLEPGDRIYRVNGRDFADDGQFAEWARALPGPLRLLVERDGQVRVVEVSVDPPVAEDAA